MAAELVASCDLHCSCCCRHWLGAPQSTASSGMIKDVLYPGNQSEILCSANEGRQMQDPCSHGGHNSVTLADHCCHAHLDVH